MHACASKRLLVGAAMAFRNRGRAAAMRRLIGFLYIYLEEGETDGEIGREKFRGRLVTLLLMLICCGVMALCAMPFRITERENARCERCMGLRALTEND